MKLRMRGDSLRLRLTQSEVKRIAQGETVKETTHFLSGIPLHYILSPVETLEGVVAQYNENQIIVSLPMKLAKDWAKSESVSIKREENKFSILIEKDFTCLKERKNEIEDESDMFSNPNSATGHCE
jgi:hypothetical protein